MKPDLRKGSGKRRGGRPGSTPSNKDVPQIQIQIQIKLDVIWSKTSNNGDVTDVGRTTNNKGEVQ